MFWPESFPDFHPNFDTAQAALEPVVRTYYIDYSKCTPPAIAITHGGSPAKYLNNLNTGAGADAVAWGVFASPASCWTVEAPTGCDTSRFAFINLQSAVDGQYLQHSGTPWWWLSSHAMGSPGPTFCWYLHEGLQGSSGVSEGCDRLGAGPRLGGEAIVSAGAAQCGN